MLQNFLIASHFVLEVESVCFVSQLLTLAYDLVVDVAGLEQCRKLGGLDTCYRCGRFLFSFVSMLQHFGGCGTW